MRIEDVLSGPVITCPPTATVGEVAALMNQHDMGSVAVVEGETLVGLFTERDVVAAVARQMSLSSPIGPWMTERPDTVEVDVEVAEAASWVNATGYRHLPVMDEGTLVGMVSIKDLLWAVLDRPSMSPPVPES